MRVHVHTVGSRLVDYFRPIRGVEEPLVAHVALAAAKEDIGTFLSLHTLVTADTRWSGSGRRVVKGAESRGVMSTAL